jgi:hypothetical protein
MQPREQLLQAKRWAKFPATVLFAVAVLWLLQNYFELDWEAIGEQTETGVGIALVLANLMLIPIGSLVIGVCALFTQRWSLWAAGIILLGPLVMASIRQIDRVDRKFADYNLSGSTAEYGQAVMTLLLIIALWAVYLLVVYHLRKALYWHSQARQWTHRPLAVETGPEEPRHGAAAGDTAAGEESVCLLMPDAEGEEGS